MKVFALLTLIMLFPEPSAAHPLHLSITNIVYENGKLSIQMKSFRDDWETGYFHYHGVPVDFTDPSRREIPWFREYQNNRFRIALDKNSPGLPLEIDTIGLEEDAMTIVPESPNSLYIYNALLVDIYPDQNNLVIFVFEKKETGIKFDIRKHDAEVILR